MSAVQLIVVEIAGTAPQVAGHLNRMGLASYAFTFQVSGVSTVVWLRVPAEKAPTIRRLLDYAPEAWDNPPPYELFAGIGEK